MTLNKFYHLTRADFLERVRGSGFIIMLAVTAFLSYMFAPPLEANYTAVAFGEYRLLYNSAGIGLMFGITVSLFISLFAFYLVKNGIARDRQSHVGQIIATTPTSKAAYLLGKWGSNLLMLTVIVATMSLMAPMMQWLRGEATAVSLTQLILPIWLIGLPMMSLVAGTAVLFESVPFLRGGLGNIAYFFLWSFVLIGVGAIAFEGGQNVPDPYGVSQPVNAIYQQIIATDPGYQMSLNILGTGQETTVITWQGGSWTATDVGWRLFWLLAGGLLAVSGAFAFDRFNPANVRAKTAGWLARRWQKWAGKVRWQETAVLPTATFTQLTPLTSQATRFRPAALLLAELRLLLNGQPWYLFAAAIGLFIYNLVTPLAQNGVGSLYPLILPVLVWSALGARERQQRTESIIFTTPHPLGRQLPLAWLAGVLVALMVSGGFALRLGMAGAWLPLVGVLSGAMFVPALAVALGTLSGTRRLFEIVYLTWWYLAINAAGSELAWLDFTHPQAAPFYLLGTAVLLATAVFARARR